MAAPVTVSATGYFLATRGGAAAGEATLRMQSATQGTLSFGGEKWKLTGDPATKRLHGAGSSMSTVKPLIDWVFRWTRFWWLNKT